MRKVVMVMYSMWEEVRDEMQKVADATKEELARMVEETREEIHKAVRGAKDDLAWGDEQADFNAVDNHTASSRSISYTATLNPRLPSTHPSMLARM